jgi:endonuclease YncB( thermonuclease family)
MDADSDSCTPSPVRAKLWPSGGNLWRPVPTYNARVLLPYAIDGDTIKVLIDLGWRIQHTVSLRLNGVDAPELVGVSETHRRAASNVKQAVSEWTTTAVSLGEVRLVSDQLDKYGRSLGDLVSDKMGSLCAWLSVIGLVRPYPGGTRSSWTDEDLIRIAETKWTIP